MQPVTPSTAPFTYEDYAALPGDGRRWELIDGEFDEILTPSPKHQTVSRRLKFELMRTLEEPGIAGVFNAPIDVILSETVVVQPDLVIVREERPGAVSERGIEAPPDLVVEILSPSTRVMDQRVKKGLYARFGVPEYWLVDPQLGSIEQYVLTDGTYKLHLHFDRSSTLTSPSFPEVNVSLARVFR